MGLVEVDLHKSSVWSCHTQFYTLSEYAGKETEKKTERETES